MRCVAAAIGGNGEDREVDADNVPARDSSARSSVCVVNVALCCQSSAIVGRLRQVRGCNYLDTASFVEPKTRRGFSDSRDGLSEFAPGSPRASRQSRRCKASTQA